MALKYNNLNFGLLFSNIKSVSCNCISSMLFNLPAWSILITKYVIIEWWSDKIAYLLLCCGAVQCHFKMWIFIKQKLKLKFISAILCKKRPTVYFFLRKSSRILNFKNFKSKQKSGIDGSQFKVYASLIYVLLASYFILSSHGRVTFFYFRSSFEGRKYKLSHHVS